MTVDGHRYVTLNLNHWYSKIIFLFSFQISEMRVLNIMTMLRLYLHNFCLGLALTKHGRSNDAGRFGTPWLLLCIQGGRLQVDSWIIQESRPYNCPLSTFLYLPGRIWAVAPPLHNYWGGLLPPPLYHCIYIGTWISTSTMCHVLFVQQQVANEAIVFWIMPVSNSTLEKWAHPRRGIC